MLTIFLVLLCLWVGSNPKCLPNNIIVSKMLPLGHQLHRKHVMQRIQRFVGYNLHLQRFCCKQLNRQASKERFGLRNNLSLSQERSCSSPSINLHSRCSALYVNILAKIDDLTEKHKVQYFNIRHFFVTNMYIFFKKWCEMARKLVKSLFSAIKITDLTMKISLWIFARTDLRVFKFAHNCSTFDRGCLVNAHFPQRGLNLKSCVLPIFLQEP